MQRLPPAVFLMGPTASGKTNLAVALLERLPLEIISVDSALVFKEMDIGTAKPDTATLTRAPHHLINIIPPTAAYSAAQFRSDALPLMADISARGKIPLLVGGTMLYFKALENGLHGLPSADQAIRAALDQEALQIGWPSMHARLSFIDPDTAARLQPNDMQRIQRALEVHAITGETMSALYEKQAQTSLPYRLLKIALIPSDRAVLHARIAQRFEAMLSDGLVDEVQSLCAKYPVLQADSTAMRCVGYRQTLEYLTGVYDASSLRDKGIFATRQLAKRQLTWLRGMHDTTVVDCLDLQLNEKVFNVINQLINE